MPVFLSASRFARVSFPKEQFGLGTGVETFRDVNGNIISKQLPFPNVKFVDGRFVETRPKQLEMLRKHPGNKSNGGELFWEQAPADALGIANMTGRQSATCPDEGLTDADREILGYLARCKKAFPPKALDNVRLKAAEIHARLKMTGINPPPPEFNISRVKYRLGEMLGIIEDCNVWKDGDADADGENQGQGKRANG